MTDNSDFMARYLPPENAERREPAAPAPGDTEDVSIPDPRMPEPGPGRRNAAEAWSTTADGGLGSVAATSEDASPAPGRGGDEGAHCPPAAPAARHGQRAYACRVPRRPRGSAADARDRRRRRAGQRRAGRPVAGADTPDAAVRPAEAGATAPTAVEAFGGSGRAVGTSSRSAARGLSTRAAYPGRRSGQEAAPTRHHGVAQGRLHVHRDPGEFGRRTARAQAA